jgi:16S rRNA (uracil1498-N3)-methyltransferase
MIRLYVSLSLSAGKEITLEEAQAHYVQHVMRMTVGQDIALFNAEDGEWLARICGLHKKKVTLEVVSLYAAPHPSPDIWLVFAPIKAGRIDFLIEKATELGVSRLLPVKTRRCVISRVNEERLYAHAVEAAEQTGRHDVPEIAPFMPLESVLECWDADRPLLYGDESGQGMAADALLSSLRLPLAVLIGPEGGFAPQEFAYFNTFPFMHPLVMGKRILRADTAALAALTLMQHYCGDW